MVATIEVLGRRVSGAGDVGAKVSMLGGFGYSGSNTDAAPL